MLCVLASSFVAVQAVQKAYHWLVMRQVNVIQHVWGKSKGRKEEGAREVRWGSFLPKESLQFAKAKEVGEWWGKQGWDKRQTVGIQLSI